MTRQREQRRKRAIGLRKRGLNNREIAAVMHLSEACICEYLKGADLSVNRTPAPYRRGYSEWGQNAANP